MELAIIYAGILLYIWRWQTIHPRAWLALLAMVLISHIVHRDISPQNIMLRDDGMVYDDGTTSRLGPERYFMTTTSGHADAVAGWIDEWLQCEWPSWRVFAVNVTTVWACIMVTGPRARDLLQRVGTGIDLSREACRFMTVHEGRVADVPCRLLRY